MGLNLEEKFRARIRVDENDCWLWQGALQSGYGRIKAGKKDVPVHRLSYECYKEKIPEGLVIDHLCRVRNCVNPEHLEPVTISENTRRGNAYKTSGAYSREKTHCPKGHPYSGDNLKVRTQGRQKWQHRQCRACIREYKRDYRRRHKKILVEQTTR